MILNSLVLPENPKKIGLQLMDSPISNTDPISNLFEQPPLLKLGNKVQNFMQNQARVKSNSDKQFDGAIINQTGNHSTAKPLQEVLKHPFLPKQGEQDRSTVTEKINLVQINGITNTLKEQKQLLEKLASILKGSQVIGVHNATNGFLGDVLQSATDRIGFGKNPAVDTIKSLILDAVKTDTPITLLAHSQATLITKRGITAVIRELKAQDFSDKEIKDKLLQNITIVTSASVTRHYPDGPKYFHLINDKDILPKVLGFNHLLVNFHPGEEAKIHHFSKDSGSLRKNHLFLDSYLPELIKLNIVK